jgi:hypothetical protein
VVVVVLGVGTRDESTMVSLCWRKIMK